MLRDYENKMGVDQKVTPKYRQHLTSLDLTSQHLTHCELNLQLGS